MMSDDDVLKANESYSITHLRTLQSSLDGAQSSAHQQLIAALAEQQKEEEGTSRIASWKPADAFAGKTFNEPTEVNEAFDQAKADVLELIAQGKTVKVI